MAVDKKTYEAVRNSLRGDPDRIIVAEKKYMEFLTEVTEAAAESIYKDFGRANDLAPFWIKYAPKQRGRKPRGTSIPWAEVGEKTLTANLLTAILRKNPAITFPGLPFGGDVRFATDDALIHFDIKLTGPNDNPDELVVPPQQISGNGMWNNGVINSRFLVEGPRAKMRFQPKLPPFYIIDGRVLLCLSYFLKAVYKVEGIGSQPLDYVELVCVPNGLLLFDGPVYAKKEGLLIPGKDDRSKAPDDKRTRVRLTPLTEAAGRWRCVKIERMLGSWTKRFRV